MFDKIMWAVVYTMGILVVVVDFVFWRPL